MADKELASIPFFAHEAETSRLERMNRRLWILLVVLVLALIGSNLAWVLYENQFTDEVYTNEVEQDSEDGGTNTFTDNRVVMGGDYNGIAEGEDRSQTQGNQNQ